MFDTLIHMIVCAATWRQTGFEVQPATDESSNPDTDASERHTQFSKVHQPNRPRGPTQKRYYLQGKLEGP
jgi:hypothetical protein